MGSQKMRGALVFLLTVYVAGIIAAPIPQELSTEDAGFEALIQKDETVAEVVAPAAEKPAAREAPAAEKPAAEKPAAAKEAPAAAKKPAAAGKPAAEKPAAAKEAPA